MILATKRYQTLPLLLAVCCGSAGCWTMPFERPSPVPMSGADAQQVREDHIASLPEDFEAVSSLTFEIRRFMFTRRVAFLGVAAIDTTRETFGVVGMNPMGVRLFEITGDKDSSHCAFALPELTKRGDLPSAIAADIRKVYHRRSPGESAEIEIGETEIRFSQPEKDGVLEYAFGGSGRDLVEKRYLEDGRAKWAVWFYEYETRDNRRIPNGIIVHSYQHNYRLILRLKEMRF